MSGGDVENATRASVLVVASWYPNVVDLAAGRFVADQIIAVAKTGRVAPRVVSFDPIPLVGGATARARQAPVVHAAVATAIEREEPIFVPGFGVEPPFDVARLAVADGSTPVLGTAAAAEHRRAVLRPLGQRLAASPDGPPALVHSHTGYPDGAASVVLADALGCPLVITEHATFLARILAEPTQRELYAAAVARASRVIAVSELLADQIRAALPGVEDRLVVIPNAIAIDEFSAPPIADRRRDELLFVGYRKEIKGIDTLIEAFALIRARRPGARLRLIGGGPDEALERRWHELAARLGVTDAVSFEGVAGRADIAQAMAGASVFTHASRYETFGVVAAEALAAGLPVVATDSGGVSELMASMPSGAGEVVAVDDSAAFAAAVLRVLDDRAAYDPARLRASVVARFGLEAVGARIAALYDEVLGEWRGRPGATRPPQIARTPSVPRRGPPLLIGLDRAAAGAALGRLPDELRRRLTVVTSSRPQTVELPPVGRLLEVPVPPLAAVTAGPGGRNLAERALRFAVHPRAEIQARRDRDGLTESGVARATAEVRSALFGDDTPDGPFRLVPLDGRDVEVAARLGSGHAWLGAGGVRRLADEWRAGAELDEPGSGLAT
ncbi:MAG TPA: glycosyltransferase [Candidatus Limnocylindrales bacterium]|nr:glycosyltransferase [Candidatus Limnocylindrales bacterium]